MLVKIESKPPTIVEAPKPNPVPQELLTNDKTLLLLDFNGILWREYAAHPSLSFGGDPTGGIYGFVNQLVKQLDFHRPGTVVVCEDKRPYLREQVYKQFKANRISNLDENFYNGFKLNKKFVEEFLSILNIPIWSYPGLEADDVVAQVCRKHFKDFVRIVIVSSDDDFYQLFQFSNVVMQKSKGLYTVSDFYKEFPDISILDWEKVIAMSGTHNGLPGLKGVGRKTAVKILKEGRYDQVYKDNKEMLDLFLNLVHIPYIDFDLPSFVKSSYNERAIIKFFSRLGITLKQYMRDSFELLNK